ncbi:MAG: RDD family protein, partial [Chloroflexota bacterium]
DFNYASGEKEKPKNNDPAYFDYAGIGQRFLAVIIDSVVLNIISGLVGGIVGFVIGLSSGATTQAEIDALAATAQAVGGVIGLVIALVYYLYIPPRWDGKTVGKNVMGIKIVRSNGDVPGVGTMFMREFIGKFVSSIVIFIGYLVAFGDDEKRTWHDRMADTRVVRFK